MRKILILVVSLSMIIVTAQSQVQEAWAVPFSRSSTTSDAANVNAVDQFGNIYVAGISHVTTLEDYITIIKYNTAGTEIWRRVFGGGDDNYFLHPVAMVLDEENIYVAGTSFNTGRIFTVIKYDLDGDFRWIKQFGGVGDFDNGHATDMAVDQTGNVYVTGYIATEPSLNPLSVISNYFTVKLNWLTGVQEWVSTYNGADPGNGTNIPSSIAVDPSGNTYITGTSLLNGHFDIATIKYSPTGSQLWVQRYNGNANGEDGGNDIVVDGNNNVYVTGYAVQTGTNSDFVTIKYDTDGNQLWLRSFNSYNNHDDASREIILDQLDNLYITGAGHDLGTDQSLYDFVTIKYKRDGTQLWVGRYNNGSSESPQDIAIDIDNNVYVAGRGFGSFIVTTRFNAANGALHWAKTFEPQGGDFLFQFSPQVSVAVDANYNVFVSNGTNPVEDDADRCDFITIKYSQCNITCPSNIIVNNDPGKCEAIVNFNPATYTGDCGSTFTYSHNTGISFPVGVTTVTVTSDATGASCSFTITVVDNENPVITFCPASKTVNMDPGVCYATASSVNAGTATATDNCTYAVVGTRSDGLALTANYSGGNTIIKWTATDASNNTTTCSQTITLVDNQPPVISGESSSIYVLSPPNHTMRDATINYTATDNCAVTSTLSVTSNEPVNGTGDGDTDPDWVVVDNHSVQLRAERSANGNGRIYTVTITATDAAGNTSAKTVEVRVPHNIKNPHSGKAFIVGSTVNFEGEFWDKAGNKHTAKWIIDGAVTAKATVTEPVGNKNGKVTGSYKFTAPGVYKLQMNISDQTGLTTYTNTAGDLEAIVVIYDPNGGHTYGGGYFNSPAGALTSDPTSTGKASYGFAMNYFKNSTFPKGETQFEFKVGDFEFNALNFDYLVISNSMAQFKGTGKIIGGQSGIGFTMTVVDGQLDGTGIDKIRMKIFNKNNGTIIYDNQPGASDAALPTQAVGTYSLIVISGANSSLTKSNTGTQKAEMESAVPSNHLDVIAYPNPSRSDFRITVQGDPKEQITIQVVDMFGRVIEIRKINAQSVIEFGVGYRPGSYFVRIIQGKQHKELKLIKLSD